MEIIRGIVFLGFIAFGLQIGFNYKQLNKKGIQVSNRSRTVKSNIVVLFLGLFFVIFTAELISHTLPISVSFLPDYLHKTLYSSNSLTIIGAFVVILSLLCLYFTLTAFKNSLRFGLNPDNLGKLVTHGIFSRSRNPFFLSILLLFIGISLAFPTPFFAAITVLSILSIHFFILKEERFMQKYYGEDYFQYARKTKRYWGKLRNIEGSNQTNLDK